ncbi:MAG TPA: efflux RND transporter permease subunit [Polyangia bacterium]|jgi:multidrug efflux pump subunit AcrB|nr:efflux RND transporter permease subunit [Polyangia bacterium]
MWIVRLALRRPYTVLVSVLVVFLFGGLSIGRLKRDVLPNIDIPVVIVIWNFPGLPATEMEKRVVFITERALSTTVNGIERIESQSLSSVGLVRVYFEQGTDIGAAIAQINAVCNTIVRILPPGMTPPNILQFNASNVQVAHLTVKSDSLSEQELFDYGLNFLRLRLFTIPGLSTPAPFGGRSREVVVDLEPQKMQARGVSAEDVVDGLVANNVILPAGQARIGGTEYDVLMNSSPSVVEEFNTMPLKVVNGMPVLLGDVAHVHDGYAVQTNIVRVNGRRATYLSILRKVGSSTLTVVDAVRKLLPSIKAAAPPGTDLSIDFDQSVFVRAAISSVLREAAIAAGLVSLMIFFFLGSWRLVVIVCTSIPIALLFGVVGLFVTGQTLNLMTLGGLALAVGMLVDDATVEIENIHRNRLEGKALTVAILDGAHQVAVPALAATLTICIVFFPVVMLEGPARYLFVPLAIAVIFSMLASYLLSRTLVPTLARRLMPATDDGQAGNKPGEGAHSEKKPALGRGERFNRWRDGVFDRFRQAHGAALSICIDHRRWFLAGGLVFAVVGLALIKIVGFDFFPSVDAGQMRLHVRAPIGTRLEDTDLLVGRIEQTIRQIIPPGELDVVNAMIGVPTFYNLAFVSTDNVGTQDAELLIQLRPKHHPSRGYQDRLRRVLPEKFPGVQTYFMPADVVTQVLNFGLASMIDVQIEGKDPDASFAVARGLLEKIRRVPGTEDVRIGQVFNHPALRLDVDRQQAMQLDIRFRDVAASLLTSLSSSSLTSPNFWVNPQNGVNYTVAVQTPVLSMTSVNDLLGTSVTPQGGGSSPSTVDNVPSATPGPLAVGTADVLRRSANAPYLGGIARLSPAEDRASINHYTVQPIVDVQASVEGRDLGAVASDIQSIVDHTKVPANGRITIRGQAESMKTSFASFGLGLIVALILVYLLLMVLFQSAVDPLIIMVAVVGAFVGIAWILAITATTLNVESFMGAIMAIGIAVSNSILLVSFANQARAENDQLSATEAALQATATRLRPVLMTALAMILGMLPMALALGEGGEQNAPLGRAVIGGLIMATVVTLFVVPTIYVILRRRPPTAHQLDQRFKEEAQGAVAGAP